MSVGQCILAIELSTSHGEIAVTGGGQPLFTAQFVAHRSHNSLLFGPLGEALKAAGDDLGLIVVGAGPGSYTGVRIAIAAAHGMALSRNVPVIGWPSITAPEAAGDVARFAVLGDARRSSYYFGMIENGSLADDLELLDEAAARAKIAALSPLPVFSLDETLPPWAEGAVTKSRPSALMLAHRAMRLTPEQIAQRSNSPIEPFYVREAFITEPKRPWLRA